MHSKAQYLPLEEFSVCDWLDTSTFGDSRDSVLRFQIPVVLGDSLSRLDGTAESFYYVSLYAEI